MPPKRSKQISESTNMRKKKLREDQNAIKAGKMAAQHSNTADLRALLQATLEQLGDTYDPTGYAYVNVGEGSCADSLQTEDPLGSQEKTSAKGTFLHTLNLHANGTQSIITNMVEGGAEEVQGSAFLSGLSVDYLDETVGCGEIEPTDEPSETCPNKGGNATAAAESTTLVAQRLSVTELRQMLQAALKHEETSLNVPDSPKIISSTANVAVTTLVAVENPKHGDHLGEISGDPNNYTKGSEKSGVDFEACTPQLEAKMDRTEIHIQTQDPHPSTSNILEIERPHSQENHAMDIEMDIEEHLCEELSLQHDDNRESHVDYEEVPPADEGDWVIKYRNLEHKYMELLQRHKKCKQRYSKLENDKLSSDDYALRVGKELMQLKDKQHMPQTRFTVDDDINITVEELDEFNARADTDSMFVGLLATRLVGSDALAKMSVTGQVSHRFGKLKNPDGTPKYPAAERLDPLILEFIGNKVAERTAIKVGCQNIPTIRKRSDIALVKRYIAQKIANLRKAAQVRNARAGTGPLMVALPPTAADAALHHC